MKRIRILLNGIIRENPVWVLLLGTCPTLATTTSAVTALGMGISLLLVLISSNTVISLLRKSIPNRVRIPAYIVIIAGFVTVVSLLMQGFLPKLYDSLGIFLPLIVVNCIILARAEAFASKNGILDSILDACGMGIGFTIALLFLGTIREILGFGTFFGINVLPQSLALPIFSGSSGGFLVFAFLTALFKSKKKSCCEKCKGCGGKNESL